MWSGTKRYQTHAYKLNDNKWELLKGFDDDVGVNRRIFIRKASWLWKGKQRKCLWYCKKRGPMVCDGKGMWNWKGERVSRNASVALRYQTRSTGNGERMSGTGWHFRPLREFWSLTWAISKDGRTVLKRKIRGYQRAYHTLKRYSVDKLKISEISTKRLLFLAEWNAYTLSW